jgi:hypothetical protein
MRPRSLALPFLAAMALAVVLPSFGPAPADAIQRAPEQRTPGVPAAANAVPGPMLTTPRVDALVKRLPVRVAVRLPPATRRFRVHVHGRDVTARFRGARGSLRVAHLTRGDGLRHGPNRLVVLAERRGRRPVVHARSFVLARHHADLVSVRLRPGPVTSLDVRAVEAPRLAPAHFGQPGEVARRLAAIRRDRTLRAWLNGRPITRAVHRAQPTRWTASLSASQGLRPGVNRLRMLIAEPDTGRYKLVRRRFVVRRDRHLAAAGWNVATRLGRHVRLDGRRSRAARGARPHHSWRIIAEPRGSRAELRRPRSARPHLTPDRPGRYVVGLTVTDGATRGTATQATPSGADKVAVTVAPSAYLVPFKGLTFQGDRPGIQVGDTFYPNPSPAGHAYTQWLTLDRGSLTLKSNRWFDGSGTGDNGLQALRAALSGGTDDDLVILSHPRSSTPEPPVKPDQVPGFKDAMKLIGVDVDPALLAEWGQKLVIAGVPYGGEGSGWYTHGGGPDGLTGWLMHDATKRFRFQSERPTFDTSSSSTPTANTMSVRGQRADAALPEGATGGFQVAMVDPIDFDFTSSDRRAVFATNGVLDRRVGAHHPEDPTSALNAMAKFLNDNARSRFHVVVQSIGRVAVPSPPANPYEDATARRAWAKVADALAAYGANPHTFNTVDGSYAFLGGSWLGRGEVAESSSAVVIDPTATPPKHESGTLSGRASMRADGNFKPVATDVSEALEFRLYDTVFTSPEAWLYTEAAGHPDAEAYDTALADITAWLPRLNGYAGNLRLAYADNPNLDYSGMKVDLLRMPYPGDGYPCIDDAGHSKRHPGYTRAQFCALSDQLQLEFDWLAATKALFDSYKDAFDRSAGKEGADLRTIGSTIRTAIAPDRSAEIGWSVGAFIGNLVSAALVLSPSMPLLAAWEALVVAYELTRETVTGDDGKPVGDQITEKVDDLANEVGNRMFDNANALDRLHEVINSDYGRLQALGSVADRADWKIDVPAAATKITTAAKAHFSSQLMPVAYGVHHLAPTPYSTRPTADNCFIMGYGHSFKGAPASAQLQWANFPGDGNTKLWALGRHKLSATQYAYPPAKLTDPMFRPVRQAGYGMRLPQFLWQQYQAVPKAPPTDIAYCH